MFEDYFNSPELSQEIAQYSGSAPEEARSAAEPIMGIGSSAAAAAPSDFSGVNLSGLGGLYGMNFGTDFGGGAMGGIYPDDPDTEYIAAPTSNKGNFTAQSGNVFVMRADQPVRLVDLRTNTIVFEGVGYDAARKATELGQSMTDSLGRKANYDIQTANPSGNYTTVANEKYNKSTMEVVESTVLDLALPIIMNAIIPGSGFLSTMAGNALGSVASGVIQGKGIGDIVTSAVIAGAVGGFTQQTGLDKAIGGALNDLGSNLTKKAVEEVGEEIVVTGLGQLAQAAGGSVANTLIKAGLSEVTGYKTPAEKFTSESLPEGFGPPLEDAIVVSGNRVSDTLAGAVSGIGGGATTGIGKVTGYKTPAEKFVEEPLPEELQPDDTIVVTAPKVTPVTVPVPGIGDFNLSPDNLAEIDRISDIENDQASDEIVVTGRETTLPIAVTPDPGLSGIGSITDTLPPLKADPALTDDDSILDTIKDVTDVVGAVTPFIPLVTGGGGGGGTRPPDTTGLTFTPGTLTPTIPVGGIGGAGGYPYTPQTYGRRGGDRETEYVFFTRDPVTGQETVQVAPAAAAVNPATVPVKKEGGEINDDMVKHLVDYHKNGGHRGPGQVKGIGSGQEDKIPAYLSDGEYVWSAQDVADLGDGSTDEGVRRLDKMRQMVRRQAGRKDVKKIAKPQKGIDTILKAVGGMA